MMNIRATITSRLGLFTNPLVDAATSANDFDFADMRRTPMSIYMTITPDNLGRLQPIINLFFQQCIDVQMRDGMPEDHREMRHKVLFMLDEFPAIGQIQVLKKANAFVAQYGLRMVFVVQALSQLVELYGEMGCESLVKNCGMEVIFPPNHQRERPARVPDRQGTVGNLVLRPIDVSVRVGSTAGGDAAARAAANVAAEMPHHARRDARHPGKQG